MLRLISVYLLACLSLSGLSAQGSASINGLSFVAPPRSFDKNPMLDVVEVNANWISVIPYAYTRLGTPTVVHDVTGYQWWGERPEGIRETIKLAHEHNLRVMIKPQVYVPGSWPAEISFEDEADWEKWERDYEEYLMTYVDIAVDMDIEAICIGTELRESIRKRKHFWIDLIAKIKQRYTGQMTYAANWDDYFEIDFWDQFDYIGVDSYFPLSDETTPNIHNLSLHWHVIMSKLDSFSQKYNRKILFTEYGYLSVDGSAGKHWELEKNIETRNINEQAQSNALEALLNTCSEYSCWAGGFLWKWFPNGQGHEGYLERDYTPQDKLAEYQIKSIYGRLSD